ARRHRAVEVDPGAVAERVRGAGRQAENGAQMILKLTRRRALDGPVTGVVHARGHLVGDQPPAPHEELERQDPGVAEMLEHARQVRRRRALPAARPEGRAGEPQDAPAVNVAAQRVDAELAAAAARADDRGLTIERYPLLVEQRRPAEPVPGALRVGARADHRLTLAVVAEAARLEHAGHAGHGDRARELRPRY